MPASQWEGAKVSWCGERAARTAPEPLPSTTAVSILPPGRALGGQ